MPNLRILLVDDDRLILATLGKALGNAGYSVTTVDSGEAALAAAERNAIDIAVLDMRMPGLSGIDTARRLRDGWGIPVLFLTAYGDVELVQQAIAEGGLGYLVKPVDPSQLIPAIETAHARARDLKALTESKFHLEQALDTDRSTSVAVGILMERRGLEQRAAFETLRNGARKRRRKLSEYSGEVVRRTPRADGK